MCRDLLLLHPLPKPRVGYSRERPQPLRTASLLQGKIYTPRLLTSSPTHTAKMSSKEPQPNDAEKNIEIWKVKKLIKRLEAARGNGTSMISLIIRM